MHPVNAKMIYYSILSERNGAANYQTFNSLLDVAHAAGANNYIRIGIGYTRVDEARNLIAREFCKMAASPNDALIMLDADHLYPCNVIEEISDIEPELGIVAAIAHRRGSPYDPMFFYQTADGKMHPPQKGFEYGPVYECDAVATSCILIRRWVFDTLKEKGFERPYFRYEYNGEINPSEDMYFSKICKQAGIKIYCDTGIEIPHATIGWIDKTNYNEA